MNSQLTVEKSSQDDARVSGREEAREIQQSLLPMGGLRSSTFEIAYRFSPLEEVGGDFADFFMLPNGSVGIYVGDVVGKGLSAAMYGALVMGAMRGIHKTDADPAGVLAVLNRRLLVRPIRGRFCMTMYATFNPATRDLTFANAGMPFPLLVSGTHISKLGAGGLPSALFPGSVYDQYTVRLYSGDSVLFATDGLHELRNSQDEDFAPAGLAETWGKCGWKSAAESLEVLFDEAKTFSNGCAQHDDITAIVLKIPLRGPGMASFHSL
jgi:sigma-B regulation protein RsbU (phosphoserine phosphatase)